LIIEKSSVEAPKQVHHHKPAWKRQLAVFSRWLHIYLSMVSFGILFFFAVTGLTLNHTEWFASQQRVIQVKSTLNRGLVRESVRKLEVVEHLRTAHGIRGAMSDFRVDDAQCSVSFKGPGYTADVFIDRATGSYDLTETRNGFFAVMNDLHKGRDSGKMWAWLIDGSALLMIVVSLSGFILIFLLAKRRFSGLMVAAAGALVCWAFYLRFVP